MTDKAWNAPFVRAIGMLLAGNALDEVDEHGRHLSGDMLLILLNAHHDTTPFALPTFNGKGKAWLRVIDTMQSAVELAPQLDRFIAHVETGSLNGIVGDVRNFFDLDAELMFSRMLDVARRDVETLLSRA